MDRCLLEKYPSLEPWGPKSPDYLTIAEIEWLLDDLTGPRPHGGYGVAQVPDEIQEAADQWRRLTPREKLQRVRERLGR